MYHDPFSAEIQVHVESTVGRAILSLGTWPFDVEEAEINGVYIGALNGARGNLW